MLVVYRDIRDIRGDVLRVRAPGAAYGDLAFNPDGTRGLARSSIATHSSPAVSITALSLAGALLQPLRVAAHNILAGVLPATHHSSLHPAAYIPPLNPAPAHHIRHRYHCQHFQTSCRSLSQLQPCSRVITCDVVSPLFTLSLLPQFSSIVHPRMFINSVTVERCCCHLASVRAISYSTRACLYSPHTLPRAQIHLLNYPPPLILHSSSLQTAAPQPLPADVHCRNTSPPADTPYITIIICTPYHLSCPLNSIIQLPYHHDEPFTDPATSKQSISCPSPLLSFGERFGRASWI